VKLKTRARECTYLLNITLVPQQTKTKIETS
jgi:hypothetical protein